MTRLVSLFFFLWVAIAVLPPPVLAETIAPVRAAIDGFIRPNFERFADISELMVSDVEPLCERPSRKQLKDARSAFRAAATAWARVEFVRVGPLSTGNRAERILFWPDRRGTGLRQVQAALANKDGSVQTVGDLSQKSVALQGFGALEYLLFGTGSENLATAGSGFRCAFAVAAAQNISAIAREVSDAWNDDMGHSGIWLTPGPENESYRTDSEALAELVGTLAHGFEMVRDQRLRPIAPENRRPGLHKRALFWRSDATVSVINANLSGMQSLFDVSGLADSLTHDQRWLAGSIAFEFSNARKTISGIKLPIDRLVGDTEQSSKLAYLLVVTRSLQRLVGEEMANDIGLSTGFSPMDGD